MADSIKALGAQGMPAYGNQHPDTQRAMAVAAALELIAINLAGAGSSGLMESEIRSLSEYADQIQEALKTK
ncbi:hypothetical protein ACF8SB_09710 [Pseudomonas sp. CJQ_8]|uniref:hypothetical protein n=1 Tax=Pseudomonas sp. CJQ_8 TaxID=3367167 RepID=UPI00370C4620